LLPPAVTGAALTIVVVATIVREIVGWQPAGHLAIACLCLYVFGLAAGLPRAGKAILIVAMAVGLIAMVWVDDIAANLLQAGRTASYYATLFTAVGFLRAAAETSPLIRRCGWHMMAQSPSRRYAALTFGSNLFSLILSFGTLQLLGTMVRRANTLEAAGGDANVQAVRARRLYSAVLRGFAMSPGWSPLSVALAIALAVTPGTHWQTVLPVAFVTAMGLLALGWLMDVFTAPRGRPRVDAPQSDERWTVHLRLIALIGFIFLTAVAIEEALSVRLIDGVILGVPTIAIGWLVWQVRRRRVRTAVALVLRRIGRQIRSVFPTYRMEVTILASAGFAGTMIAAALPTELIAAGIRALHLPPELIPGLVVVLIVLGGQLAMNPIISVSIVAAILPPPEALGTTPAVVAASYMIAWGLCVGGSPFTLSTLIIGGIAGKTGRFVGHVWNGAYTIIGVALVIAWFAALSWLLGP